jgi:prolyl 4-hydroxylase
MLGGTLRRIEEHLRKSAPATALAPGPAAAPTSAAAVSALLSSTPGLVRIPQSRLEAFVVPDFLTAEECARLKAEDGGDSDLLDRIEARMAALMGLDPSRGEAVEMQAIGAEGAAAAFEYFDPESPDWPQQARRGGQRNWTIMGFLDAPEDGGEIVFPNLGFTATPARGFLLLWNNLAADGAPNRFALHETRPVTRGIHHRFVKRYRERTADPEPATAAAF